MASGMLAAISLTTIAVSAMVTVTALHGMNPDEKQDPIHSQDHGTAAPNASAPDGLSVSDPLRQFDLVCDTYSTVSGNPAPDHLPSTPALTADPWQMTWRIRVDLDRMQYCSAGCGIEPPSQIRGIEPDRIILDDPSDHPEWIRLSDGTYYHWLNHGGRIIETTGTCTRSPFSGIPQVVMAEPEPENPGLAARRFDLTCQPDNPPPDSAEDRALRALSDDAWPDFRPLNIDLEVMRACRYSCDSGLDLRVIAATEAEIEIEEGPEVTTTLDRLNGAYSSRRQVGGRTAVARAHCRSLAVNPAYEPRRGG